MRKPLVRMAGGQFLRSGLPWSLAILAVLACVTVAFGPARAAAARHVSRHTSGKLTIQMVGLPRGTRGEAILRGRGIRRRMSLGRHSARVRLPTGRYRIRVVPVKIRHARGGIKRGALAKPDRRVLRVRVRVGRSSKRKARYGTIVNPGVRTVTGKVAAILGDPLNPSGVVLKRYRRVRRGQVLTARPNSRLPHGLLARVTSVKRLHGGRQRVALRAESIYEVAPNMSFDVPLSRAQAAKASASPRSRLREATAASTRSS